MRRVCSSIAFFALQDQLLKLAPQPQQIQYYGGTPVDLGVRVGTGLVLTLAASKVPLLAAGTLFYPLWWPIYKAWSQNQKLRSQYKCAPAESNHARHCRAKLLCVVWLSFV